MFLARLYLSQLHILNFMITWFSDIFIFLFEIFRWEPLLMKLPKNFLQKIQDFQNVYDHEVFSQNKIQIIWSTHHPISQIPKYQIFQEFVNQSEQMSN